MKAMYNSPKTDYVSFDMLQLMAGSLGSDGPNDFNLTDAPETTENSGNLSRRRTVWDDEDIDAMDEEF